MKIVCVPEDYRFTSPVDDADLNITLYGHADGQNTGAVGANIRGILQRHRLEPAARALDLLSIALSVVAADTAVRRNKSSDGWSRTLEVYIAVSDPDFWTTQRDLLERQLQFLTTDAWKITFLPGGVQPVSPEALLPPQQDCILLLSGGLDSLIGAIDLVKGHGKRPYAISQVSRGDKQKQIFFASNIKNGLVHLQLNHNLHINHNAQSSGQNERSQRARSIVFLAYGVLVATALQCYRDGEHVTFYVCENGFISINPPLTSARIGSLSTKTTHPRYIQLFQELLDAAGIRVRFENPYQYATKGEMMRACVDQDFLRKHAHNSTSCGRYASYGCKHCGRCVPCLIRRAAFHAWGVEDKTDYVFRELFHDDENHARHDDVRCASMAVAETKTKDLKVWAGSALSSELLDDVARYEDMIDRGLSELGSFLEAAGVE